MSPELGWPYDLLGLDDGESDLKAIKRAYARQLKAIDPARSPDEFQALREAYEAALAHRDFSISGSEFASTDDYQAGDIEADCESEFASWDEDREPACGGFHGGEIDEVEVWHLVQTIRELEPAKFSSDRLEQLLDNPMLLVSSIREQIEEEIYESILRYSWTYKDGGLALPDFVDVNLARILDDNFYWLSDYQVGKDEAVIVDDDFLWALLMRSEKFEEQGLDAYDTTVPDLLAFRIPGLMAIPIIYAYLLARDVVLIVFYWDITAVSEGPRQHLTGLGFAYLCLELVWTAKRQYFIDRFGLNPKPEKIFHLPYKLASVIAVLVILFIELTS
jgi:hypothetical protein